MEDSKMKSKQNVEEACLDSHYSISTQNLRKATDPRRTPIVLIACGSFNPITYLHLRLFEMARDWIRSEKDYEVVGGYMSPVGDTYKKAGLIASHHRVEMCRLAVKQASSWVSVDSWEAQQKYYVPTALALDYFNEQINEVLGGIETTYGPKRPVRISLLAGADLLQTMSIPELWSQEDLDHILGHYGAFIVERSGTDIKQALDDLQRWRKGITVISQSIHNDVSSTKIRNFLMKNLSIHYLIPEPAIKYIEENGLYHDDDRALMTGVDSKLL